MDRVPVFLKKNLSGLLVFFFSLAIYAITMSPTTNFWDSGEFIASANGLQVPHPPGAPLYLLLARVLASFAPTPVLVAPFVNFLSVVASAFAVFFIYKILLILISLSDAREGGQHYCIGQIAASGGALLFAFTDSFWYSAVEAEVYALSLFFSVLTLWVFLLWYTRENNESRLFFLGVYFLGLSIAVHLLNLLLVPVFVLIFFWKKSGHLPIITVKALLVGVLLLGLLFFGFVTYGLWPAMKLELFLVNGVGMPQHSGLWLWVIILMGIHVAGIHFTFRKQQVLHLIFVTSALIFMGWFSYALVPVRASAGPAINMNDPDNVFSLNNYINRTQYGSRPLLYGPHAGATVKNWEEYQAFYFDEKDRKYQKKPAGARLNFKADDYVWFPRMYSRQAYHLEGYEWWTGLNAKEKEPSFAHQLDFFLKYQMGHNFLRYLMWNLVGRQNDHQGHGDILSGNWASGIDFIDRYFLGNREYLSSQDQYSPAANFYFGIPLLLVLLGGVFLLRSGNGKRMNVLTLLILMFVMMGPAIVLYLNQPPYEPRERDYVFVGAFMTMSLFAGMGIYGILKKVLQFSGSLLTLSLSGLLLIMAGPGLMFSVNLNDHDRSERYLARDLAASQLRSCPPNAILFTYGDNDTYPLWYAQQVEKVRPDVHLVNIGLLGTDWYVEQMTNETSGGSNLQLTLPISFYRQHALEFFRVSRMHSSGLAGKKILSELASSETERKEPDGFFGHDLNPIWTLRTQQGKTLQWNVQANFLSSGTLALMDFIFTNASVHPVCFTRNVEYSSLYGLENRFVSHGLIWKLGGEENSQKGRNSVMKELALFSDSIQISREDTWYDYSCRQALSLSGYRQMSLDLARDLLEYGEEKKASEVLRKSLDEWPYSPYQEQAGMLDAARLLMLSGEREQAEQLVRNISYINLQDVYFYFYSGFDTEHIRRKYCGFFKELKSLAKELELKDVTIEIDMELHSMCDF
ncbi:glycosyltransferase family 117 protein [Marinilabilia rubra]|uniref:DUF2723 domain-containing protein n=1 Tax=Marinilabilia rubra TaxID=2162893 RepID=A0A2U2BBH2_9BACT|nr:DUF2723 domain-containing protein [Marinilabilia rubra]PWE00424.1 DUF2723 domain-containing protein [Marinilabilia rubra]